MRLKISNYYIDFDENINFELLELLNDIKDINIEKLSDLCNSFQYYFNNSNILEHDSISKDEIIKIQNYLLFMRQKSELTQHQKNHTFSEGKATLNIPNIEELYKLMFKNKEVFRKNTDDYNGFIGVLKHNNSKELSFYNIGIDPQYIESEKLQEMVNYIYTYKNNEYVYLHEIISFICYLLYERIHPHPDGNGRIGRLLFIENVFNLEYFPLSKILNSNIYCKEIMTEIFNQISFPFKYIKNKRTNFSYKDVLSKINYKNKDEYNNIYIDESLFKKILKLLCLLKEFKYLFNKKITNKQIAKILLCKNNDDVCNKFTDEEYDNYIEIFDFNTHFKIMEL